MKIVWHVLFFVVVNLCWLHVISVSLSKGWPSVLIRWQKPNSVWLKSKRQSRVGNENVLAPVKKSKGNQSPSWLDWIMPSGLSLTVSPSLSSISLVLAAFSIRLWCIILITCSRHLLACDQPRVLRQLLPPIRGNVPVSSLKIIVTKTTATNYWELTVHQAVSDILHGLFYLLEGCIITPGKPESEFDRRIRIWNQVFWLQDLDSKTLQYFLQSLFRAKKRKQSH